MLVILFVIFNIAIQNTAGKDVNLQYTTVSYTLNGKPCINDCVNSKCVVDKKFNEETCEYSDVPAPIYYTSLSHPLKIPKCLSRCDILAKGLTYEQCFITNNDLDHCINDFYYKWVSKEPFNDEETQSLSYEINADSCKLDGYSDMCIDAQGIVQESGLDKSYRSLQLSNLGEGLKCDEECKIKDTTTYYSCYNKIKDTNYYCAPLAQPPSLRKIYSKIIPIGHCPNSTEDLMMNKDIATTNNSNLILEAAERLQKTDFFPDIVFRDDRNAIHNCTVKPSANYGDPVLPLVIRAKITRDTIRYLNLHKNEGTTPEIVTKNLERMLSLPSDVPGTLIGYQLGGPTAMCNVVPVLPSLKETLKTYEMEIYNWVNEGVCDQYNTDDVRLRYEQEDHSSINSVYMTVVVIYKNTTRPSAIGIDIAYFKGDIEDKERVNVILCNQDPKQEAFVLNFFKRHCGKTKV